MPFYVHKLYGVNSNGMPRLTRLDTYSTFYSRLEHSSFTCDSTREFVRVTSGPSRQWQPYAENFAAAAPDPMT